MRYVSIDVGRVAVEEGPSPPPPPDQVWVRVLACGICGTDLHLLHGMVLPKGASYPVRPGHEIAGEVLDPGSRSDLGRGDLVVLHPIGACGRCAACRGGRDNLCARPAVLGLTEPGGMADEVSWHSERVVAAAGLDPAAAALLPDAVATAYHALRLAAVPEGGGLCVLGAGGVGTQALDIARVLDPSARLAAVVRSDASRRRLAEAGFLAVSGLEGAERPIREQMGRPDAVIDFTGVAEAAALGVRLLDRGGRLVLGSVIDQPLDLGTTTTGLVTREISVLGSYASTLEDLRAVVDLAVAGRIDPGPSVTHRFALDDANAAFTTLEQRPAGMLRIVVEP